MTETNDRPGVLRWAWLAFRSAITGRFVTRKFAQDNPAETVSERRNMPR